MQLPSRLRETTLGDLLAALHREAAHGVLELIEAQGRHAIHLRRGLVQAVESDAAGARFGDVAVRELGVARSSVERARMLAQARGLRLGQALVATQAITPSQLDETLRLQRRARLEHLFALRDAEVRFRVARPLPAGASEQIPLAPREVFFGRPRKRGRFAAASAGAASAAASSARGSAAATVRPSTLCARRAARLAVLGLPANATDAQARAAYKRLVLALHPDRQHASAGLGAAPGGQDPTDELAAAHARSQHLVAVLRAFRELSR